MLTPRYSTAFPNPHQIQAENIPNLAHPTDTSDIHSENTSSDLITRRITHLQTLLSSLHHYHAYRETLPAIISAYKSGTLTIEQGQLTFWAKDCQLGPVRKFDVPTTEDERLRQQVRVMGMLDEVLKVQDSGDLLWIENVSHFQGYPD